MIRIGTSGWSHEGWVGPFYPVAIRDDPAAWLRYYASRFGTVELNSTFYAMPDEPLVSAWSRAGVALHAEGVPFEFSLKLPGEVTHDALPRGDVQRAWEATARFERHVLEPLSDEGLLGSVLVQLAPTFGPSAERVAALREVLSALSGRHVAIEFRHRGWAQDGLLVPEAEPLFASRDVCLVETDGPAMPRIEPPPSAHGYVRLHGRRADAWGGAGARDGDRYDYLYARDELLDWVARAREHEARDRLVRVYFNNTPHAKAVVNAVDLLHLLGAGESIPRPKLTAQTRLPV